MLESSGTPLIVKCCRIDHDPGIAGIFFGQEPVECRNRFETDHPATGGMFLDQVEDLSFVAADIDAIGFGAQHLPDNPEGIGIIALIAGNRNMKEGKKSFQ
jgi:hypothetical protein